MSFEDVVADGSRVGLAHFELARSGGNEFSGQKWLGEVEDEKRSHGNAEGKERLDAMGHVKRRVACGLANGCAVGPKDMRGADWPFGGVAFANLDDGLANGPVLALDSAIGAGVVS